MVAAKTAQNDEMAQFRQFGCCRDPIDYTFTPEKDDARPVRGHTDRARGVFRCECAVVAQETLAKVEVSFSAKSDDAYL